MRIFSFARESTRYCNFSKDKFGNEITCIIPSWLQWNEQTINKGDFEKSGSGSTDSELLINCLLCSEDTYFRLLKEGWKPQQARQVLPFALYSPLVMTGFEDQWTHFFELRCAPSAHPDAQKLAKDLLVKFNDLCPDKFADLFDMYIDNDEKKYDIWSEGFLAQGSEGIPTKAQKFASGVEGKSFLDAVKKWYKSQKDAEYRFGALTIRDGKAYTYGCRLYDNEEDARKAFG